MEKVICIVLMAAMLTAPPRGGAAAAAARGGGGGLSCSDAVNALIPCGTYLIGMGEPNPSPQCCASAQALNKMAGSVESRRALCKCLEDSGPSFGVIPARAKRLPPFCKLKLGIPVSPTANCSAIS